MLLIVSGQVGGAVLFSAVALLVGAVQIARRRDSLRPLLPDPPPQGQFRARVSYRRDGLTTGTDEMALVFVDGWLVAEGVRSHFALRGIDVGRITGTGDLTIRLPLADGSDVRLQNIRDREGRVHVPHALFKTWQKRAEVVEGEPTLPPRFVHPQETARWASSIVIGVFLSSLGAFLLQEGWLGFALRQGTWLVGLALTLVGASRWWRLMKVDLCEQKHARQEVLAGQALPLQAPFEEAGDVRVG